MRFVQADGTVWERSGECCRCGECCKGDPFGGEGDYCPLFRWLEDGRGACIDREHPYYLNGCNVFPTRLEQIADKPSCSYTFAKVSGQNFLDTDEVDQTLATSLTGWTLGKTASGNSSEQNALVERLATTFTSDTTFPKPLAPDNTLGNGWLISDTGGVGFNGTFAAGTWTLAAVLRSVDAGGAAAFIKFRVYAVANSSGGSPRELTASILSGNAPVLSTTVDGTSQINWIPGAAQTLTNEFLLVTIACRINSAGGGNTVDCLLRVGSSTTGSRVVTTDFTAAAATALPPYPLVVDSAVDRAANY